VHIGVDDRHVDVAGLDADLSSFSDRHRTLSSTSAVSP
jgi:hypothetical protein